MMNVMDIKSQVNLLEVKGNPEGTFLLETQYRYSCTAHHPEDKSYLTCISENVWNFFNDSAIQFNIEVHFQFDNKGKRPKVSDLLTFAKLGNSAMNQILALQLEDRPDLLPLEISPIDEQETVSELHRCVLLAYPEN